MLKRLYSTISDHGISCFQCGKQIGFFRLRYDVDFCSDLHRSRYHELMRVGLERLSGSHDIGKSRAGAVCGMTVRTRRRSRLLCSAVEPFRHRRLRIARCGTGMKHLALRTGYCAAQFTFRLRELVAASFTHGVGQQALQATYNTANFLRELVGGSSSRVAQTMRAMRGRILRIACNAAQRLRGMVVASTSCLRAPMLRSLRVRYSATPLTYLLRELSAALPFRRRASMPASARRANTAGTPRTGHVRWAGAVGQDRLRPCKWPTASRSEPFVVTCCRSRDPGT